MGDGDEGMKTSPRLFFMFRTPSGRHAACPPRPLSLSLGCRASPSPRLACRLSGRVAGRGLPCRRAVRCGLSLVARFPVSVGGLTGRRVGGAAGCLLAFIVSVFGEIGGTAFLVSWLSAGGGTIALWGSSRLIGAGGGAGRLSLSACLDGADGGGVCRLCGVPFSRLIDSGETGILILVPGCCFLLSLFLGTCLLCGRLSWFCRPHRSRPNAPNWFLRGTDGSVFFCRFFLPYSACFSDAGSPPTAACLRGFITRILGYSPAYQYRPAPRPATIDTIGGEAHGYDTADGRRGCPACLVRRRMAT